MNATLISVGILCLVVGAYGLLRTRWYRTKWAHVRGAYPEPRIYYLKWLFFLVAAILIVAIGLLPFS